MATLPDLDTSDAAFAGYHKLNDTSQEAGIDPGSATSLGSLQNYTLYDNGWIGEVDNGPYTNMKVRVKSDGWVFVYVPSGAGFTSRLAQFGEARGNPNNNIGTTISNIASELNNSPSFSAGDETWYDFEYPGASRVGQWQYEEEVLDWGGWSREFELNGNIYWAALSVNIGSNTSASLNGSGLSAEEDLTTYDLSKPQSLNLSSGKEWHNWLAAQIIVFWGPES